MSPLLCSIGRDIFAGRKYDSPAFSLYFYCIDLERVMLQEKGGTAATVQASVHPSYSNKNENSEEIAGWVYLKRAVLPEEGGTAATL